MREAELVPVNGLAVGLAGAVRAAVPLPEHLLRGDVDEVVTRAPVELGAVRLRLLPERACLFAGHRHRSGPCAGGTLTSIMHDAKSTLLVAPRPGKKRSTCAARRWGVIKCGSTGCIQGGGSAAMPFG